MFGTYDHKPEVLDGGWSTLYRERYFGRSRSQDRSGRSGSTIRFQPLATIPVQPADCVKVGVAAVDIGAVVKAILLLGRFFQPAKSMGMRVPAVSTEMLRPPRYRSFDRLFDDDEQCFIFFSIQPCPPFRSVSGP